MPFKGTRAFALQHPQQGGEAGEQGQACEIGKEKPQKIPAAPGALDLQIKPQGNQAHQRGDRGAQAADVYAGQQSLPIIGEAGKQQGRWYVADYLAGADGGQCPHRR